MTADPNEVPDDVALLSWVASGDPKQVGRAVSLLRSDVDFINRLRTSVQATLRREMICGRSFSLEDLEGNVQSVMALVLEKVLSPRGLATTLLERGADGNRFNPQLGTLRRWLSEQAYWQLRGWLRQQSRTDASSATFSNTNEIEQLPAADRNSTIAAIEEQSRAAQRAARDRLAALGDVQRAVMIVKYLHFADATVLRREEIDCLWRVRKGVPRQGSASMSPNEEEDLRRALSRLSDALVNSPTATDGGVAMEDGKPPSQATPYFRRIERLDRAYANHQRARQLVDYYRGELLKERWTTTDIDKLAERAADSKLAEVRRRHAADSWIVRRFAECSCRWELAQRQLHEARSDVEKLEAIATPKPQQIAQFLSLTANAVSTALTHARRSVRSTMNADQSASPSDG